jgi:hypothetical protein
MQRVFEYCNNNEYDKILKEIYSNMVSLCENQYGNYVIQHIIEKISNECIEKIISDIKGKIFGMSVHKYAR